MDKEKSGLLRTNEDRRYRDDQHVASHVTVGSDSGKIADESSIV